MEKDLARLLGITAAIAFGWVAPSPARAAQLSGPITGWASGVPSYISMYEYVPDKLATNPPILVVSHYCGGNASGVFGEAQGGGIVSAADKYGFVMIFPQTSNNCWDVGSMKSLTHDGGGDTQAIAEMVKYAIPKHGANPDRVYAAGTSSGAMMTQALLAIYPDVFKAGAEFSGVPAGCWAASYSASNQWSGPCAGGQVTHSAQDWGNMVRGMYAGYSGYRPRVQLWHGMSDTTINFNNQTEAIKEWTDVLGLSTAPTSTATVTLNNHQWNHQSWQSPCGFTVLDAWSEQNGPHGTDANLNATYVVPFLGLDKAGPTDPDVAQCGSAGMGGSGGSGGRGGSGGSSGSNSGGSAGSSGGSVGSGSAGSAGSSSGSSGSGNGGIAGSSGGSNASGSGGSAGNAGSSGASVGSNGASSGIAGGSSGASFGSGGTSPSGAAGGFFVGASGEGQSGSTSSGCSCRLPNGSGSTDAFALGGLVALGAIRRSRRRSKASRDDVT